MSHTLTMQNIFLRQRAKEYARKHYGRLLAMAVLVSAVTWALEWLLTFLGDKVMAGEIAALMAAMNQYVTAESIGSSQAMLEAIIALFTTPKFWLYNGLYLAVVWLCTQGMSLGHTAQYLRAGNGEQPRVLGVFSRMKQCFKALRLNLWMGLKTFLWALPGVGVMALGGIIIGQDVPQAGSLLLLGGYVLILVLVIMAALRYSLSMYILAENPGKGVIACVNESKYLMDGHKRQLVKLGVPCILMMIGVFMAVSLVSEMLLTLLEYNPLVMTIMSYVGTLAVTLFIPRLNMTYALFYLLRSDIARNASQPKTGPDGMPLPAAPAEKSTTALHPVMENIQTRKKAKALMQAHRWPLLAMGAITLGIPYAMMMLIPLVVSPISSMAIYDLFMIAVVIAVPLIASGLMVGFLRAVIDLCRSGQSLRVGAVFHYMHMSLRIFGLNLLAALKTFLWMLPGYVLFIAGVTASYGYIDASSGEISADAPMLLLMLMLAGMVLICALAVPAAIRYQLSAFILADKPNTGVLACVRHSKALMKGRKWQAFKLAIPIYLVMYVVTLVMMVAVNAAASLLAGTAASEAFMSVAMMIVMLVVMLYYMVRMVLCYAIFYLKRTDVPAPAAPAAEEAPAEEIPTKETTLDEVPTEEATIEEVPAEDTTVVESAIEEARVAEVPAE